MRRNYNNYNNRGYKRSYYKRDYNKNDNHNYHENEKNEINEIKENAKETNKKKKFITKKNLIELATKDDNEIIQFFLQYKDITEVINNTKFNSDMIYLLAKILAKIVFINSGNATIIIKQIIENTNFIENNVKNSLRDLNSLDIANINKLEFILNLLTLSDKLLDKFSQSNNGIKSKDLLDIEDTLSYYLDNKSEDNKTHELITKIMEKIKNYREKEKQIKFNKLKEKEEQLKSNKNDIKNSEKIPIDYKEANFLLKYEDFKNKYTKEIAPHIKSGPYYSFDRYLNTNFYLEREDCYRSLRNAIHKIQSLGKSINLMNYNEIKEITKNFSDLYFYKNGEIQYLDINSFGIVITIDFMSIKAKKIKFTKRMITGSLIVLTDNNFSDYLLGIVCYNPYFDLKENKLKINLPTEPYYRVQLSLINTNKESILFLAQNKKQLQIFESKAYFESYIHIMKRLQQINTKDLPFKNELIDANFDNIKISQPTNGYKFNNITIYPNQEPSNEIKSLLDESQIKALNMTLENKIALIQGPPGTGKTHFGAIICDILLQNIENNLENINNPSQILIVCFTNHALDQFAEKMLKFTKSLVRIGGRCKNEAIKKYEFVNTKKSHNYKNHVKKLKSYKKKISNLTTYFDTRKRISIKIVKERFPNLCDKIINDFLALIPYYFRIKITPEIENKIYRFWAKIGSKNNSPDPLIKAFLENMKMSDKKKKKFEYKVLEALKNCNIDNIEILNILNRTMNDNNNNNIQFDEIENNEEEDEINNDEEEILENDDNLKYMQYNGLDNMDGYFNQENENEDMEDKEDELLDENNIDFRNLNPLNEEQFNALINSNYNFFRLGPKIVKLLIEYMKNVLLLEELNEEEQYYDFDEFSTLLNKKNEIGLTDDAEIIKKSKIVCMTTTACAKYSTILEQLNFSTIIIEEAAEVKESHIISLLTKNTKRLILIGDHKQLKPKPYNYEIATKYNFNISLFERLINNKIPYISLKYQRRMKSKFADFVRIIYGGEDYIDYDDDKNKENIKGMVNDMYFITHNEIENENPGLKSKENDYEAKYISKLCNYLILQNYNEKQITILTFYIAQVILIKKYLKKYDITNVKVTSIDNYQGEENDIILLSLVRSNKNNELGFLSTFNRVCVAFSRAKLGFYIIGNIDSIVDSEQKLIQKLKKVNKINNLDQKLGIWKKIKEKAEDLKIIGNELILECQNHKNKTIIKKLSDFENCPEGGCQIPCKKRMKCGHACEKLCHVYNCNDKKCFKPCAKQYSPCNHPCKKLCYENCEQCQELVDKKLKCGHIYKNCICSANENSLKCEEKCNKKLKCGHICKLKCYEICFCKEIVEKKLQCGHISKVECGNENLYEIICQEKCGETNLECGHECKGTCGQCLQGTLHIKCESKCGKILCCGHPCEQRCCVECFCEKKCQNVCPHGYCDDKCYEICIDCEEKCPIGCKHGKCKKKCGEICDRVPCEERCEKKMKCGHQCYGLCGEKCPNVCRICKPDLEYFTEDFFYLSPLDDDQLIYITKCGHIFSVDGLDIYFKEERKIQMFACPKCKQILFWEPRYQNYIREKLIDVQKVKKVYLQRIFELKNETYYSKSKEIVERIINQFKYGKINIFDSFPGIINYKHYDLEQNIPTIYSLCNVEFEKNNNNNIKKYTAYNLLTLAEKFMGIEYYKNVELNNEIKEENDKKFIMNYNIIKKYFSEFDGKLTYIFFRSLKKKIDNMLYYSLLKLQNNFTGKKDNNCDEIANSNFNSNIDLKEIFKNTYEEIKLIKSLGTTWYKCPNGHLYTIGECGRPMEESECPECKDKIGGTNHNLLSNNTLANLINESVDINENILLNQDENVYNEIKNNNQEPENDPEVVEYLRTHPEANEFN